MQKELHGQLLFDKVESIYSRAVKASKKSFKAWIILLPSILLFYFMVWRPIGVGIFLSFFKLDGYKPADFVGFKNYIDVIEDMLFLKTLWNTVLYVLWSLLIGYLLPIIIAIFLNEIVHFKSIFKFTVYFPAIVPTVAASLIWYFMYMPGDGGILNSFLMRIGLESSQWLQNKNLTIPLIVISMTWRGCGAAMIIYLASIQGISQELYEATTIDGAGFFMKLKYITIPCICPVMMLMFIRQIIGVFQIMVEPLTMTGGGPNNASVSLGLQGYNYAFANFQTEKALALGVITFIILMIITVYYFKLDKKMGE